MEPDHVFVTELYRYRSNFDFLDQELAGGLWASAPSKLNDPYEGRFLIDKAFWFDERVEIDNHGVVSLSDNPTNEVLWSYYADGHYGYCIRYGRIDCEVIGRARPVFYSDAARVVRLGRSKHIEREVLRTKSTAWSHEREWRIIHDEPDVLIEGASVTAIVLGLRTRDADRRRVEQCADELGILCGRIVDRPETSGLEVKWVRKTEEKSSSLESERSGEDK